MGTPGRIAASVACLFLFLGPVAVHGQGWYYEENVDEASVHPLRGWTRQARAASPPSPTTLGFECTEKAGARLFADVGTAFVAREGESGPREIGLTIGYASHRSWVPGFLPDRWVWDETDRETVAATLHLLPTLVGTNRIEIEGDEGARLLWKMAAFDRVTVSTSDKTAAFSMDSAREALQQVFTHCPTLTFTPDGP